MAYWVKQTVCVRTLEMRNIFCVNQFQRHSNQQMRISGQGFYCSNLIWITELALNFSIYNFASKLFSCRLNRGIFQKINCSLFMEPTLSKFSRWNLLASTFNCPNLSVPMKSFCVIGLWCGHCILCLVLLPIQRDSEVGWKRILEKKVYTNTNFQWKIISILVLPCIICQEVMMIFPSGSCLQN